MARISILKGYIKLTCFNFINGWVRRFSQVCGRTMRRRVYDTISADRALIQLTQASIPPMLATLYPNTMT